MNILNIKDYKVSKLKFIPRRLKENSYNISLLYQNKEFILQSPLCTIKSIQRKENNTSDIILLDVTFKLKKETFNYNTFFGTLDLQIHNYIKEFINNKDIQLTSNFEDIYKPAYLKDEINDCLYITLHLKVTKETLYFNKNKSKIHHLELKPNDKIVFLFYTKGVFLDNNGINYRWTATEILKYK